MLFCRDDNRFDIAFQSPLGLVPGFQVSGPEYGFPVSCSHIEEGPGSGFLLFNDVSQAPPSPRPGIGESGLGLVFREHPAACFELLGVHIYRAGQVGTGRLGQHARNIMKRCDPMPAEMSPSGKLGCIQDSLKTFFFQFIGDVGPVPADLPPYQGIRKRTYGITVRRDIESGPVASHMMVIDIGLGYPVNKHSPGCIFRFRKVMIIPITVIVMSAVLMI